MIYFIAFLLLVGNVEVREISSYLRSLPVLPLLSEWTEDSKWDDVKCFGSRQIIPKHVRDLQSMVAACRASLLVEMSESVMIAEIIAKAIADAIPGEVCTDRVDATHSVDDIIEICNKLVKNGLLCKGNVSKALTGTYLKMPLEVLVKLAKAGLLILADYIDAEKSTSRESLLSFHWHEVKNMIQDENSISVVLEFILFVMPIKPDGRKATQDVFNLVTNMIYDIFETHDFSCIFTDTKRRFLLPRLGGFSEWKKSVNPELFSCLLTRYLRNGPKLTIEDSYHQHKNWTFSHLSEASAEAMEFFILNMTTNTLVSILSSSARDDSCNFQRMFTLISVWLIAEEDSIQSLKGIINMLLRDCLEIQNCYLLKLTLLLPRHCSLEQNSGFPTYENWLKGVAGDLEPLFVSNRDALGIFIKGLTDILPLESRDFLLAHISVLPQIHGSAKNLLNEYFIIARTMLKDLSKEESSSAVNSYDSVSVAARGDVERGLRQFQESGTIPKSILEMSVFRKGYFVGSFLPVLLAPEAVKQNETRQSFIEYLRRAGKVPTWMYNNYCQEVEKEKASLQFEKAGSDLNVIIDIVMQKIKELPRVVNDILKIEETKKQRTSLQLYVASLSEHIVKLNKTMSHCEESSRKEQLRYKDVIDVFLDSLCNAFASCLEHGRSPFDVAKWLVFPITRSIQNCYEFTFEVKMRVLTLLHTETNTLEKYHMQALAGIVAVLDGIKKIHSKESSVLRKAVFCSIGGPSRSFARVTKSIEFVSYLLFFCKELYTNIVFHEDCITSDICITDETVYIDSCILEIWLLMQTKLIFSTNVLGEYDELELTGELKRTKEVLDFVDTIRQEKVYSERFASLHINLKMWVEFEMEMDERQDLLPSYLKIDYYYRIIHFNAKSPLFNDSWTYSSVASAIVMCMLTNDPTRKLHAPPVCSTCHDSISSNIDRSKASCLVCDFNNTSTAQLSLRSYAESRTPSSFLSLLNSLNKNIALETEAGDCDLFSSSKSWLYNSIDNWLTSVASDDTTSNFRSSEYESHLLCNILDALPSGLLFGSTVAAETDADDIICDVIALIDKVAKLFCNCKPFLPCSLTVKFLAALVGHIGELGTLDNKMKQDRSTTLQRIFSSCPIFAISTVRHLKNTTIAKYVRSAAVSGVYPFDAIVELTNALKISDYNKALYRTFSRTIVAVAIYNDWYSKESHLKEACLSSILNLSEDMLEKILECVLWNLLSSIIRGQPLLGNSFAATVKIATCLVAKIPVLTINLVSDILQGSTDHGLKDLRSLVVRKQTAELFPLAFIKVLAGMDALFLKRFSKIECSKTTVVQCIKNCDAILSCLNSGPTQNLLITPFDLEFLKEVSNIEQILEIQR